MELELLTVVSDAGIVGLLAFGLWHCLKRNDRREDRDEALLRELMGLIMNMAKDHSEEE